jgi:hypothetical protein
MALTRPRAAQIYNLDYKQATRVVTVSNITLSGGAPSQVDGVNLVVNDRILVTGQSTPSQNGLYLVSILGSGATGTWARTSDANDTGEIEAGMIVMVTEGLIYADTQWKLITDNPIAIGTTPLTFTQNYSANSISSGTSNVAVYSNSTVNISSAGSPNVLVIGSTTITATANLIPSANITYSLGNTTNRWSNLWLSNSTIYLGNVTVGATANTLTVNSANVITSDSSGNISTVGNVIGGNILTTGIISAGGNLTAGNISAVNVAIDRGTAPDNWDTLINMGTYSVDRTSWSGMTGAPVDSTVYVGLLSVLTSGTTTTQTFYPGTVTAGNVKIQWDRTLYSGTWTSWYKIINDFQVVDAGTY